MAFARADPNARDSSGWVSAMLCLCLEDARLDIFLSPLGFGRVRKEVNLAQNAKLDLFLVDDKTPLHFY